MPREESDIIWGAVTIVGGPPGSACFPYNLQGGGPGNFSTYLGLVLKCREEAMADQTRCLPATTSARSYGPFERRSSPLA